MTKIQESPPKYYKFSATAYNYTKEELDKIYYHYKEVFSNLVNYSNYHTNLESVLSSGIVKNMGWKYDLRCFLKRYLIKDIRYGEVTYKSIYAINKTAIRSTKKFSSKAKIIPYPKQFE
jgi:hypothetical protein